jgi:YHS domain-containing protein
MKTAALSLTGLALALFLSVPAVAQAGRNAKAYNLGAERLALQGYDPVAYFDVGGAAPRVGDPSITHEHEGVVYRFAKERHRELFKAAPATYEPAHGGWCSYAMSKNKKVGIDPKAFRVGEGRLLLFVDKDYTFFDGDWVPDEHELLGKADKNWKAMSGESARTVPSAGWFQDAEFNLDDESLAIEGYDPVAYHPEGGGKPREGKKNLELRHENVRYRFANKENMAAFRADPEKYKPQHGGWCSYAMGAHDELVEVDPEAYRLLDGQLHLFFVAWYSDTRDDWDEDTAKLKKAADKNWKKRLTKALPRS